MMKKPATLLLDVAQKEVAAGCKIQDAFKKP